MGLHGAKDIEARFKRYVEGRVSVIGHEDRDVPLHDYCLGLVMPGERKSVEPMAAITAPGRTAAQHQSFLPGRPTLHAQRICSSAISGLVLNSISSGTFALRRRISSSAQDFGKYSRYATGRLAS